VSATWPARLRGMCLRGALIAGLCLVIAGSAGSGSGVRWETGVGSSPISHTAAAPEPTIAGPGNSLPPGEGDAGTHERAMTASGKSVEQKVQSPVSRRSVARSSDRASDDPGRISSGQATVAAVSAAAEPTGCLSVNATPFASVYVDGQHIGETPRACLRVRVGERRIQFQAVDDRSPERVVLVTERHTADQPFTIGYDFRSRQFREP